MAESSILSLCVFQAGDEGAFLGRGWNGLTMGFGEARGYLRRYVLRNGFGRATPDPVQEYVPLGLHEHVPPTPGNRKRT